MKIGTPQISRTRISQRLGMASIVALGAALLLAIIALTLVEHFYLRQALLVDSRIEAKILADNIAPAVLFKDRVTAEETLETMRASPLINSVTVLLPDQSTFIAAVPVPPHNLPAKKLSLADEHRFSPCHLELVIPLYNRGEIVGYLYVVKMLNQLYWRLAIYSATALGIGMGAMLLAWFIVARVQRAMRAAESRLHDMAHIDAMTATWNRNTFNSHLNSAIGQARRLQQKIAVLLLDLDNFKAINDKLGHHGGDILLQLAAQRLINVLRRQDIVCRLGGDEFAIVLQDPVDADIAQLVAGKITALFSDPFLIEAQELYVTCSLGISIFPSDATDQDALVRNADTAMYQAKTLGKNQYKLFTADMNAVIERRAALEINLRRAFANNELSLHYQPQIDLRTQRIVGAETLLRWHSAELGEVTPAEFIPLAEETGLIVQIGEWVLRTACEQLQRWRAQGLALPMIAVNLSARQLYAPALAQSILDIVRSTGIGPQSLELELTESILMENVPKVTEEFALLQAEGIHISIDDFGTGYSSMSYLKRLPLNKIKIDRTFIRDLSNSSPDREIVNAIIAMSHSMGLTVIAEGVEDAAQLEILRTAGCDIAQGFYLCRPAPAAELETFWRNREFG